MEEAGFAMNLSERAVIVKELPRDCSSGNLRRFLHELVDEMAHVVRPAVVLDCSHASRIDRQSLHLFLSCLEAAMKRNGDLRLAGLHQDALPVLESAGAARLLRNFSTPAEAVRSYHRPPASTVDAAGDEPSANAA
jgi:anti-sigma B factor antagonist